MAKARVTNEETIASLTESFKQAFLNAAIDQASADLDIVAIVQASYPEYSPENSRGRATSKELEDACRDLFVKASPERRQLMIYDAILHRAAQNKDFFAKLSSAKNMAEAEEDTDLSELLAVMDEQFQASVMEERRDETELHIVEIVRGIWHVSGLILQSWNKQRGAAAESAEAAGAGAVAAGAGAAARAAAAAAGAAAEAGAGAAAAAAGTPGSSVSAASASQHQAQQQQQQQQQQGRPF